MSAQANIVAFDGASTPVIHTFVPVNSVAESKTKLVASYREAILTVPLIAQSVVTMVQERLNNGMIREAIQVRVPNMESISGQNTSGYTAAPKVAFYDQITIVGSFHERSTITSRRLVRQLALNIANGVTTSVVPVTVGPAAELLDQMIVPS